MGGGWAQRAVAISQFNFLICSERSGSNLIRAIMNAHPQVYAPQPLHYGKDFFSRLGRYGDLNDEANWSGLLRAVVERSANGVGKLEFDLSESELIGRVQRRRFEAVYAYIYKKGMRLAGKQCVFIKENHTHRYVHLLALAYPDAKFVFQVRDPRDFLVSCKRVNRWGVYYGSRHRALDTWRDDQEGALTALRSLPGRVFVQRYEDLISDPRRVLSSLCAFLGLPFDDAMLEFSTSKDSERAVARCPIGWKNLTRPIMHDNKEKWRTQLSAIEIHVVESRLSDLMAVLGYPLSHDSNGAPMRLLVQVHRLLDDIWFFFWSILNSLRGQLRKLRGCPRRSMSQPQVSRRPVLFPYEETDAG